MAAISHSDYGELKKKMTEALEKYKDNLRVLYDSLLKALLSLPPDDRPNLEFQEGEVRIVSNVRFQGNAKRLKFVVKTDKYSPYHFWISLNINYFPPTFLSDWFDTIL